MARVFFGSRAGWTAGLRERGSRADAGGACLRHNRPCTPLKSRDLTVYPSGMRIDPNWKRPLFYLALPIILYICFMVFPPFCSRRPETIRVAQEQSVLDDEEDTQ